MKSCFISFNSEELILCEQTQLTGEFMARLGHFFAFACDAFRSSSDWTKGAFTIVLKVV